MPPGLPGVRHVVKFSGKESSIGFNPDKFGSAFLANPDLPERFRHGAALNAPDKATFYTPGARGYTDYSTLDAIGASPSP
jgi:hypothetical protein